MREELERIAGPAAVSERPVRDLWPLNVMRRRAGAEPPSVLVVRPTGYETVSKLLAWASETGTVIVPLGGGSGVCGALEVARGQIALDLGGFDRVIEVDERDLTCRVQAGVLGTELERQLNDRGLTLGHYPSSLPVATIGGLVSTRSSGQESVLYGNVEDMLLGLKVALPDGRIADPVAGPRAATGPALHQLFVGSEGALGVVLEAVLRVHRLPEQTIGVGYAFESLGKGLEALRAVVQAGVRPLVMRLYDPEDTAFQGRDLEAGECLVVIAVAGPTAVASAQAEFVRAAFAGGRELGEEPWTHWREHRFHLSAARMLRYLEPAGSFLDTIELAAPWNRMEALHGDVKRAFADAGVLALCHFSHASGQGCCAYFSFAGSAPDEPAAQAGYAAAWAGAMEAAVRNGAAISHHHGVGQARSAWIRDELGGWWDVWQAVRTAIDPASIMNPNAVGGSRR